MKQNTHSKVDKKMTKLQARRVAAQLNIHELWPNLDRRFSQQVHHLDVGLIICVRERMRRDQIGEASNH